MYIFRQLSGLTIHPYLEVYDLNLLVCTRYKNSSINASAFLSKILLAKLPVKLCSGLMLDKNGWKVLLDAFEFVV